MFDYFSAVIAMLSLCLSLYEIISRKLKEQTKISLYVDADAGIDLFHFAQIDSQNTSCCFPCLFVNDSDSDISITKIEFETEDGTIIKCSQREEHIYTYLNPQIYGPVAKSISFPINLARKQGAYGVIKFDFITAKGLPEIKNVIIHTNKKSISDKRIVNDINSSLCKLFDEVYYQNDNERNPEENECTHTDKE